MKQLKGEASGHVGVIQDSSSFGTSIIDFYTDTLEVVDLRIRVSIPSILFKALSITLACSKEDASFEPALHEYS